MSDTDIIAEEKQAFELAADAESHNRIAFLDDIRFGRLAEQWPDQIRIEREQENRPVLTINLRPALIRQVVNDARQNKPQIKVQPVDGAADMATSDIYCGVKNSREDV